MLSARSGEPPPHPSSNGTVKLLRALARRREGVGNPGEGRGEKKGAYDSDLEVGREAAEYGALRRRGVLLRLGRHRARLRGGEVVCWDGI